MFAETIISLRHEMSFFSLLLFLPTDNRAFTKKNFNKFFFFLFANKLTRRCFSWKLFTCFAIFLCEFLNETVRLKSSNDKCENAILFLSGFSFRPEENKFPELVFFLSTLKRRSSVRLYSLRVNEWLPNEW